MPGCERADILRWGYAVEYDMVWPHQIDATCMTKAIGGLFLAGQINCTTGYEEAGAQGVVAGLNAARRAINVDAVRIGRDQAYIGVMLDDLVTKTPREPYRMFTSRAEYRLFLRGDNADRRLTPMGRELGLVDDARWSAFNHRAAQLDSLSALFETFLFDGRSLRHHARRPDVPLDQILSILPGRYDRALVQRVVTESRYDGYISRQRAEIRRQAEADRRKIPDWFDPCDVNGLRREAVDALRKFKPATLGQAGRLAGINPADITLLAVSIERGWRLRAAQAPA
jgi:tRNA uridine 5-carboxymethylaminomethyl modification enzyme